MGAMEDLSKMWTPENFFWYVFVASNLSSLWDVYLHYRQHRVYHKNPKVPNELVAYVDEEDFKKAREYGLDKSNFSFIQEFVGILQKNLFLWFFMTAKIWNFSSGILAKYGYTNQIVQTIVYFFVQQVFSTILGMPFSLYFNFVIEERHGFNKYTLKFYFWDQFKKFLVFQPITSLFVAGTTWIIMKFEDQFFFYLWLFCCVLMFVILIIYPSFIAPLFDKYTPLEEGSLRTRIEDLARNIKFPLTQIYVVDNSTRSTHSNAYFYGFFKTKRIVLFDTLFEEKKKTPEELDASKEEKEDEKKEQEKPKRKRTGCTETEIVAIICHELGHWYHSHVFKNLIISQLNLFFVFLIASRLYNDPVIFSAFGFTTTPVIIGLMLVIENVFLIYFEIFGFCMSILSRHFEFQADQFAKDLNFRTSLINALIKLNKDNLSFPVYDWLYSALLHSHPPILDRINALKKID